MGSGGTASGVPGSRGAVAVFAVHGLGMLKWADRAGDSGRERSPLTIDSIPCPWGRFCSLLGKGSSSAER